MEIPPGFERYQPIDFHLSEGEKIVKIAHMKQTSRLREYVVSALLVFLGYEFYLTFSKPSITPRDLILPAVLTLLVYFLWHLKVTETIKSFVGNVIKYTILILVLSYMFTSLATYAAPLFAAVGIDFSAAQFSLNPIDNFYGIFIFLTEVTNTFLARWSVYLRYGSLGITALGAILALLTSLDTRSYTYYLTNKRIIVRRKMGSTQVTDMPLDSVVEVTAFQSFTGRLLGYGDLIVALVSGGGVTETLKPGEIEPVGSTYRVTRKIEGVGNVWELKDLLVELRNKYVETEYLTRIEGLLTEIRDRLPRRKKVVKVKLSKKETEEGES